MNIRLVTQEISTAEEQLQSFRRECVILMSYRVNRTNPIQIP